MTPAEEKAYLAAQPAAVQAATGPIVIHGNPGWKYSISGAGFGPSGTLTIAGMNIPYTRWDDENIRGDMPIGAKGEIVITPSNGKPVRKGVYPTPIVVATKTTIVETVVVPPAK